MKDKLQLNTPEIAYTIPYEWGQLHMTEAADDAYGITPLTTVVDGGSDEYRHLDYNPSIDLTIVSPEETDVEPIRPTTTKNQKSLAGVVNLGIASDEFIEANETGLAQLIEQTGMPIPEDEIEKVTASLHQDTPQMLAHLMADLSQAEVETLLSGHILGEQDAILNRYIKAIGTLGVVGGIGIVAPAAILNGGSINPVSFLMGMSYTGYHISRIQKRVQQNLEDRTKSQKKAETLARLAGLFVSSDIHRSYCRSHFDRQFEV